MTHYLAAKAVSVAGLPVMPIVEPQPLSGATSPDEGDGGGMWDSPEVAWLVKRVDEVRWSPRRRDTSPRAVRTKQERGDSCRVLSLEYLYRELSERAAMGRQMRGGLLQGQAPCDNHQYNWLLGSIQDGSTGLTVPQYNEIRARSMGNNGRTWMPYVYQQYPMSLYRLECQVDTDDSKVCRKTVHSKEEHDKAISDGWTEKLIRVP